MGLNEFIYCDDCIYFKENENCCDKLTIGISGIPLKECLGYKEKDEN